MVNTPVPVAMEIENGLKLPVYTDTEVLMDELTLSPTEFMSSFEKFKWDEISIDEAEDDICFNAKYEFDLSHLASLIGLRYTEDENTKNGRKGKWSILLLPFCRQIFRIY